MMTSRSSEQNFFFLLPLSVILIIGITMCTVVGALNVKVETEDTTHKADILTVTIAKYESTTPYDKSANSLFEFFFNATGIQTYINEKEDNVPLNALIISCDADYHYTCIYGEAVEDICDSIAPLIHAGVEKYQDEALSINDLFAHTLHFVLDNVYIV